jgi:lipopolysaccharide exporter
MSITLRLTRRRSTSADAQPRPDAESRPLSARVRRGALWSIASTMVLRLANILLTAVVAHILDPRDFGVFAVALTAYGIVSAVGEFGVASCLIRADLDIDELAPTMATVSLATSVLLAAAMAAFARPIAAALGSADATEPVRVMALAVILTGLFAVPSAQLVRDFKQDKLFLSNVISFVPSTALLVVLAEHGSGAMAFAWSRVAGQLASGIVLVVAARKTYWPGLRRTALSLLLRFGLPLAGANFVNYILLNVDYALVGHLMGAVALGIYVLAFNVASWPSTLLGAMINNVSMPAFSRVKHDASLLRDAMASSLRALALVVMPMCSLLVALSRPLVLTLYGSRWSGSAQVLSILAVYSAVSIACLLFANILAGLGRTSSLLIVQLVWLCALAPAMAAGVHRDGIVGAAAAHVAVIAPVVLPCYLFCMKRTTGVRLRTLARAVYPAILASLAAALAARAAASEFSSSLAQLISGLSAGGLVYLAAVAPQAIALLSRGNAPPRPARQILRLYGVAARLARLPAGSVLWHAGRSGGGHPAQNTRHAGLIVIGAPPSARPVPAAAPGADSAAATAAALSLLMSMSRPESTGLGLLMSMSRPESTVRDMPVLAPERPVTLPGMPVSGDSKRTPAEWSGLPGLPLGRQIVERSAHEQPEPDARVEAEHGGRAGPP